MSEAILDSQDFYHFKDIRTIDGKKVYLSNYYYSSIREWLNNDFYNTAFTGAQQNRIATTHLESKSVGDAGYDSPDSDDKIFILSYYDSVNSSCGFSENKPYDDVARRARGTDYAKSQGLNVFHTYNFKPTDYDGNSSWWLRSPLENYRVSYVDCGGYSRTDSLARNDGNLGNTANGVRAACRIPDLRSDISQSDEGSEELYICGDADRDGEVEIRDATWIQRIDADIDIPFTISKTTADVDGDGKITVMDATHIQHYLVNMKNPYNIGKKV